MTLKLKYIPLLFVLGVGYGNPIEFAPLKEGDTTIVCFWLGDGIDVFLAANISK